MSTCDKHKQEREANQRKIWRMQFANTALRHCMAASQPETTLEQVAETAVAIADAMLTELEKNNER